MSDIMHSEKYTHKNGLTYLVECHADYDAGSPLEWSDCHGVTVRLDWNPTNEEQLEQHIIDNEEVEGEGIELEEETRYRMMRQLCRPSNYRDSGLYYDVMASLEMARTEWGSADPLAAVEADFAYLKGWYNDDWHYMTVFVYRLDENGEKDDELYHACGGYESTMLDWNNEDNRKLYEEVVNDGIADVEWQYRKVLHKNQLELAL